MVRGILSIGIAFAILVIPNDAFAQRSRAGGHATFLDIFPREQTICGGGWKFPGLINGHVPVYACVLKFKNNAGASPFGPL